MPGYQPVLMGGLMRCECTMVVARWDRDKHDALWHAKPAEPPVPVVLEEAGAA